MCPRCIHAHLQIPKSKGGAQCPIHSGEFRDRMQIDLIDYRANEQHNVYRQVMQWISMVVKDHFIFWHMLLFKSYSKQKRKVVCLL
jgi:hypothetical protein